jgi:hypothetical protein
MRRKWGGAFACLPSLGYAFVMRHAIPFDTHALVKELTATGVPEAQAQGHVRALVEFAQARVATKHDVDRVKCDLDAAFEALEMRLTLNVGAMLAAWVAITVALVKLL